MYRVSKSIPTAAFALRPMRFNEDDTPVHFSAVTFEPDAYKGIEQFIRIMDTFGMIAPEENDGLRGMRYVDVMDANYNILQTLPVTAKGFEHMLKKLKAVRDSAP